MAEKPGRSGDESDADVVLVAVPSAAIADALGKVIGLEGKVVVDATNVFAGRDERLKELEVDLGTLVSSVTCEEVCS